MSTDALREAALTLLTGKARWCVARVYRHAKGEISDEEMTDPAIREGIIHLCEEAFGELDRAASALRSTSEIQESIRTQR